MRTPPAVRYPCENGTPWRSPKCSRTQPQSPLSRDYAILFLSIVCYYRSSMCTIYRASLSVTSVKGPRRQGHRHHRRRIRRRRVGRCQVPRRWLATSPRCSRWPPPWQPDRPAGRRPDRRPPHHRLSTVGDAGAVQSRRPERGRPVPGWRPDFMPLWARRSTTTCASCLPRLRALADELGTTVSC